MIDINLGNLHLEVVGKEPDGFSHCAEAGTAWRLKQRGRCRRAWREQSEATQTCSLAHDSIRHTSAPSDLHGSTRGLATQRPRMIFQPAPPTTPTPPRHRGQQPLVPRQRAELLSDRRRQSHMEGRPTESRITVARSTPRAHRPHTVYIHSYVRSHFHRNRATGVATGMCGTKCCRN